MVQTLDYFTPVVDDPYTYGMIAAANSLSDVYAMGVQPLFALNIVGFPSKELPMEILGEILKGGADKASEAGINIIGGHTIEDKEPKYGLSVTGIGKPGDIITNAGAQKGDKLFLTKPLGIGILTTAMKRGIVSTEIAQEAIEIMIELNSKAATAMGKVGVNACTDVTGFGLLGHLYEMTSGSKVGAKIQVEKIPVLPGTWDFASAGVVPGGTRKNLKYLEKVLKVHENITKEQLLVIADAQTSGGLLISVSPEKSEDLALELNKAGVPLYAEIGEIVDGENGLIEVL